MLEVDSGEEGQEEEEWGWKERVQLNFLNLIFKREYPQILTLSSSLSVVLKMSFVSGLIVCGIT